MKKIISIIITAVLSFTVVAPALASVNNSNTIKSDVQAEIDMAKYLFKKNAYAKAAKLLQHALQLAPANAEAQELLDECQMYIEAQEREERAAYDNALSAGTKYALQQFIESYPKSKWVSGAKSHITEIDLWNKAQSADTKRAYESYLANSKLKEHAQEARSRIIDINTEAAWSGVRYSDDLQALQRFVQQYPQSSYCDEANWRIHQLKGAQFYAQGQLENAYNEFSSALTWKKLESRFEPMFGEASENHDYLRATTAPSMKDYLNRHFYPKGKHYDEVSNKLARTLASALNHYSSEDDFREAQKYAIDPSAKAYVDEKVQACRDERAHSEYLTLDKNSETALMTFMNQHTGRWADSASSDLARYMADRFTPYTEEYEYAQALNYAKDIDTRSYVQVKVDASKRSWKKIDRAQRRSERLEQIKDWLKENLSVGIETVDLGTNAAFSEDDRSLTTIYYNAGVVLRIGDHMKLLSFELGAKPGVAVWMPGTDWDEFDDEKQSDFIIPLFAKLKLNLFPVGSTAKFFIAGSGYFNPTRPAPFDYKFMVGAGLGIVCDHWNWELYYRQGIDSDFDNPGHLRSADAQFLGTSLGYFFNF